MRFPVEIVLAVLIGGFFSVLGGWLIHRALKPAPRPPEPDHLVPRAQIVLGGHSPLRDRRRRKRRLIGRIVGFAFGLASLGVGLVVFAFFAVLLLWMHG